MKKLINVRVPLFCAIGLIVGTIACKELLCGDFYFGIILGVLLIVGIVVSLILKRSVKAFALMLIVAVVGFSLAQLSYHAMEGKEVVEREVVLQGRVCDLGQNGVGSNTYYLENCVDINSGETFTGRVKLRCYVYDDAEIQVGEVLTVRGTMYSTYPVKTSVESFYVRNRIYYELTNPTLENRVMGEVKFGEKARQYVYGIAMEFAHENGGIIYALLTGDRNAIPDEIKEDFTRAGTIHLLAVSGLHVGLVVTIVCFALSKLRLRPIVEGGIVLVPLLFYAYICGFSPSVTRAVIMTACVYLSRVVLGRYDLLTSLSISAIIVLFLTPYTLFDAGFQLSFLSVFGIATLHTPVMRLFRKRKINRFVKYLLNAFLLSLSCSLATLFTLAANFGQVPLLGVFINLIAIPLISVVFALCVFGLIPGVFHYLLVPADKLLLVLVWLNSKVSNLSFATASISALAVSVAIAAVLMFILGGFVNLNKIGKRIACIACALLLVATVLIAMIPRKASNAVFVSCGYRDTEIAATSDDGEAVLVGNFNSYSASSNAVQFLSRYRIKSCVLFLTEYSSANEFAVTQALDSLPVDKVYLLTQEANDSLSQIFVERGITVVYQLPNTAVEGSVTVRSIYDGALTAVNVNVKGIDVCLVTGKGSSVLQLWRRADLYVLSDEATAEEFARSGLPTVSRYQTRFDYNYGANKYGNFTIRQKDDRIIFNFS